MKRVRITKVFLELALLLLGFKELLLRISLGPTALVKSLGAALQALRAALQNLERSTFCDLRCRPLVKLSVCYC